MKIFISRQIPGEALESFKNSDHEIVISEFSRPLTAEEFLERGKGSDAILSLLTDKIDGEVMDAIGPQLKIISNYAVGFDNINIKEASDRGILVANTPSEEVDEAVAEHTWALISALSRRVVEADEAVRRGMYRGWEPDIFLGVNLIGKTIGIVGLGGIGKMVARRAAGYNMNVVYTKRNRDQEYEEKMGVKYLTFDELLNQSDVVSLHTPLNDETRHMINKESLAKMKKGSFLINTARGPIVEEASLVESLRSGHLAGAALDVFDNEPNVSPELIGMPNVVTTPHIASATWEARNKMGEMSMMAILNSLKGEKVDNLVNPEIWESRRK